MIKKKETDEAGEANGKRKQVRIDSDIYPLLTIDAARHRRSIDKQVNAILAVRYGMSEANLVADIDDEIRRVVAEGREETAEASSKKGSKKSGRNQNG